MPMRSISALTCCAILLSVTSTTAFSQEGVSSKFLGEPKPVVYVDPGQFLPDSMSEMTVTDHQFLSVGDVVELIRRDHGIDVIFDRQNLLDYGISEDDEVFWSGDVPVFVALDRICEDASLVNLGWYLDENVLVITSGEIVQDVQFNRAFDVAPLIRCGLTADEVVLLIDAGVYFPNRWHQLSPVGNVVHIRSTFSALQKVDGFLRALGSGGTVRYVDQTESNEQARRALTRRIAIPEGAITLWDLAIAIEEASGSDVRLCEGNLLDSGISPDESIDVPGFEMHANQLVQNVAGVSLEFIPLNGSLCLTTTEFAEKQVYTALYDVSELLFGDVKLDHLIAVITNETSGPWDEGGLISEIECRELLLVRHCERVHREIQALLKDQRRLMLSYEPPFEDPQEIQIIGYRLKLETAEDVVDLIPELIVPSTWRNEEHPDRTGWIRVVSMGHEPVVDGFGFDGKGFYSSADDFEGDDEGESAPTVSVSPQEEYAVLVIQQTRAVHRKIKIWLESLLTIGQHNSWNVVPRVDLSMEDLPADDSDFFQSF